MDKLKQVAALCKCSLSVEFNEHHQVYTPIDEHLQNLASLGNDMPSEEVVKHMIETDTLVSVHAYRFTPIGFVMALHYDLDAALDDILRQMSVGSAGS